MSNYLSSNDLAGEVCFQPNFFQTKTRINYLINHYLSLEKLCDRAKPASEADRLEDLPRQWQQPQPRSWQNIDWQNINSEQIIGIDLEVFQEILQDEINHLTKFWGFGLWLYPNKNTISIVANEGKLDANCYRNYMSRLISTFRRMMIVLHWNSWRSIDKIELIYTFICVFQQMRSWSNSMNTGNLQQIFDSSEFDRS